MGGNCTLFDVAAAVVVVVIAVAVAVAVVVDLGSGRKKLVRWKMNIVSIETRLWILAEKGKKIKKHNKGYNIYINIDVNV